MSTDITQAAEKTPTDAPETAAGGRIYALSDEGETVVVEAGSTFKILARNPVGEKLQATMAVANGRIYIRTAGSLFCIGK